MLLSNLLYYIRRQHEIKKHPHLARMTSKVALQTCFLTQFVEKTLKDMDAYFLLTETYISPIIAIERTPIKWAFRRNTTKVKFQHFYIAPGIGGLRILLNIFKCYFA
jgi:hypothetical protein